MAMNIEPLGAVASVDSSGTNQAPHFQLTVCSALTSLTAAVQRIEAHVEQLTRKDCEKLGDHFRQQCHSSYKIPSAQASPMSATSSYSKLSMSATSSYKLGSATSSYSKPSKENSSQLQIRNRFSDSAVGVTSDEIGEIAMKSLDVIEEPRWDEVARHVVTWSPTESPAVHERFLGDWVDKTGAFYGGATIRICENTWYPVNPPLVSHWSATFSLGECSNSSWELLEMRANGTTRRFIMQVGVSDTCTVSRPDSGSLFNLRRKRAMFTKILTSANRASDLRHHPQSVRALNRRRLYVQHAVKKMVNSTVFESVASLIIFSNAVIAGVQAQMKIYGHEMSSVANVTDIAFLVAFILEFVLRVIADPRMKKHRFWFGFDAVCIIIGSFGVIVSGSSMARRFVVIRALRLLRLVRVLRVSPVFGSGWRLVCGVVGTSPTIFSTMGLMLVILYIWACIGVELITNNANLIDNRALIQHNFSGIFMTMLTLIQFATEDSIASIYVPLIREEPWLAVYFLPIIFIFTISLMNMVTAVIVEGAFRAVQSDREMRQIEQARQLERLTPIYREFFDAMDKKEFGYVRYAEIEHLDSSLVPEELHRHFHMETLEELFEIVDGGSTGTITKQQFVDDLLNLRLAEIDKVPTELILVLKLIRKQTPMLRGLLSTLKLMSTELFDIQHYLHQSGTREMREKPAILTSSGGSSIPSSRGVTMSPVGTTEAV